MTRHESLFAEIIFDLSYLAGVDDLHRFVEDSRELFCMIKDWAEEFDVKYPMPRQVKYDFSELHNVDYITAIDNFYIQKRNEYMQDYHNVSSAVVLNTLFKNKC
jgi:Glu-tRNA(Gln) amidotransferase subunit E-like FAD-binding protein